MPATNIHFRKTDRTDHTIHRKLIIFAAAWFVFLPVATSMALQPTFIKGSIFDAFDGGIINDAVISTATGYKQKASAGSYVLRLPPSVYEITVSAPGYRTNMLTGITTAPGQTETVNFWLAPASTPTAVLQGRVVRIYDRSGIPSALITSDLGGAAFADADGFYRLLMPTGKASISAAADNMQSRRKQDIQVSRDRINRLLIPLSRTLGGNVKVIGTVRNLCTGVKVNSFNIYAPSSDTVVSGNGTFEINSNYGYSTLLITAPGYQLSAVPLLLAPVPNKRNIVVDLIPSRGGYALIYGAVTNSLDGTTVSGARLETDSGDITYSDNDGSFGLYTSHCARLVAVTCPGFDRYEESISLHSGETESLDVSISPLPSVSEK